MSRNAPQGRNYQWQVYSSFAGGLNTAQSATKIADDEFADILNFEFDLNDIVKCRGGFTRYNVSPDFSSRITSIFQFVKSDNTSTILATSGTECYKDDGTGHFTSIKGAMTLPSNTLWQWKAFTDLAIGVNRGTGVNNDAVKWNGAGNLAALALTGIAGSPDGATFIEVWNQRLFMVFSNLPNRLYYSTLGNPEDWSISGGFIEIGYNDGDLITGIFAHKGRLFIFKRNRIYILIPGNINTDVTQWKLDDYTKDYGCVSIFTVREVLDDLVFLTHEGLLSINSVQDFGDFKTLVLSRKIKALQDLNFSIDSFASIVSTKKSVYILSAPISTTGSINNRMWVMDYKKIDPQVVRSYLFDSIRWTIFESSIINVSTMAIVFLSGNKTVLLGGDSPLFYICKWEDNVFNDTGQTINTSFLSKSYSFNNLFLRKDINRASINISFTQMDLSATFEIIMNENEGLKNSFSISEPNEVINSLWDTAIWDVNRFVAEVAIDRIVERKLAKFNRGKSVQIKFTDQQLNQDLAIKDLAFEVDLLTQENV